MIENQTELETALGVGGQGCIWESDVARERAHQVNLLLIAHGLPAVVDGDLHLSDISRSVLEGYYEKTRLLSDYRCPADQRIESFLKIHFADTAPDAPLRLPTRAPVLSRHGIARILSIPFRGDHFANSVVSSYRVRNGVLHNPRSDRRTTKGTFHVTEGGLPIVGDKNAVPKRVFAELFRRAVNPPADLMTLPFSSAQETPARTFVSLLLRPIVCPEVPGVCLEKTMEVRFFAPGSLVSNLDFVESIFGNAGDPFLPRNDAGLDVEHWTGHTGCVILAPHLVELTKQELGLPKYQDATNRQRLDGMCWKTPDEKYNDGEAFKITCRTTQGVIVTLIADNYFGYCKKEVKTQISYAANLYGNVEEEHSGGAMAFASYAVGEEFTPDARVTTDRTWQDVVRDYGSQMDLRPEGYGIDRDFPNLIYIPEDASASVTKLQVWWKALGRAQSIPLQPGNVYMTPSGYKVHMEKHAGAPSWRLIGTNAEGTNCHKPCTVSGGGKSEISKSIRDYMLYGPIFVADIKRDLEVVEQIFRRDYSQRWSPTAPGKPDYGQRPSREILSPERSLGSVIKLLTPSPEYTDEFNAWLAGIPSHVYAIVFIIKRFCRPDWKETWRDHFGVDIINGSSGNELKLEDRKLVGTYLRVGLLKDQAWRTFKVRQDFAAAAKVQTEDDITASVVVPARQFPLRPADAAHPSLKFSVNCEYRLFQRPDDAIHRGLDKQTESDMARPDNFLSNYEPLTPQQARAMIARITEFEQFTPPMQILLRQAAELDTGYVVSSAQPRIIDGKTSKNPRYLQTRLDLLDPFARYIALQGLRFHGAIPLGQPLVMPVDAVLIGRRNNPEDKAAGIRGLAVYNPIHYQELPELFMDFICSLTGKSPSTTGAGSEGALTKGPFNALRTIVDLNNALVSYILTGLAGFSTSAGYVGPNVRMDHDISLLIPEIWCRLSARERDPNLLIREGCLEPLRDFTHNGAKILASRLGYRITSRFISAYFGRVFDNPAKVFDEAILKPETQDAAAFADGVKNITEAQERVARQYIDDGSIQDACPPLRALLHIMAGGAWEGKDAHHPEVRALFTLDSLLASDWYKGRLKAKQLRDVGLWKRHVAYLDAFLSAHVYKEEATRLHIADRRALAVAELQRVSIPAHLESLVGTLGADPSVAYA